MTEPHNPTAFPHVSDIIGHYEGMTLRDYFAGQALPAIIVATSTGQHMPAMREGEEMRHAIARDAYSMADAMLAARQEGSTDDQP